MKKLLTMVLALVASVLLVSNVSAATSTTLTKEDVELKEPTATTQTSDATVSAPKIIDKEGIWDGSSYNYADVTINYSKLNLNVVDRKDAAWLQITLVQPVVEGDEFDDDVAVTAVKVNGTKLAGLLIEDTITPADLQKTIDGGKFIFTRTYNVEWTITYTPDDADKQEIVVTQKITLNAHVGTITLTDTRADADAKNNILWSNKIAEEYAAKVGVQLPATESTDSNKKDDVPKTGNSFSMALIGMMAVGAIATISFKKCEE